MAATQVSVSTHIEATAEETFDLVADLPRMGEWSPECTSIAWRGGATAPAVGSRFRGWNRRGPVRWFTDGIVVESERGRVLAFDITWLGLNVAGWAYRFEPDADRTGCTVTEEWTDHRSAACRTVTGLATNVRDRPTHNRVGMAHTLAQLRAAAEA